MKTLFSLKSRIGAILTVAALLSTAMPMTGFAATATEAPELLVNGNFSDLEAEGASFGKTDIVTLEAGTVPSNWDFVYDETKYSDNTKITSKAYVTDRGVLRFEDDAFTVKQTVNGIQAGEFYTLSFNASTNPSSTATVTVNFLNYDEEAGTYSTLADYATANGVTLMQASFGDESNNVDFTSIKYTFREKAEEKVKPTRNYKINFVAPPYTNAVEITLHNDKDSGENTSSAYYVLFDNVSLKLGTEVVNNGDFQAHSGAPNEETGAYKPEFWNKMVSAEGYRKGTTASAENASRLGATYLLLNEKSDYRLTFKYKHTIGDNIADKTPFISIVGMNGDPGFTVSPYQIGTDGDWGIYEAFFTTPEAKSNDAGLVNISLSPATRALKDGEVWEEGYAVYYDDISIVEKSTLTVNAAGGIDVNYVPVSDGETADLVIAKYDKVTNELEDIDIVTLGENTMAGYAYKYAQDASLSNDVKVFLWDGIGTMKPVASSVARPSYTKTVPYKWVFDSVGDVPTIEDGIGYASTGTNGSLSVTEGRGLELAGATVTGGADNVVDFNFDPVATGKLYAELHFAGTSYNDTNVQFACANGLVTITDTDGNIVAGIAAESRAKNKAKVWHGDTSAWSTAGDITHGHWNSGGTVKLELDFDAGTYSAYKNGVKFALTSTSADSFKLPSGANASKLSFNFSHNKNYLTYVKLYTEEVSASQTETAYTMNVGDTQQAGIAYEPTTATMHDMTFASSNTAIAEVTAEGLITAKRAGTATITATSAFYDINYEYVVTIPETVTVTPVTLNYEDNFTSGQEIKDLAGWSILNRQPNTVLSTKDGKLVATGVATTDKVSTGVAQAKLQFNPVSSGKLIIELNYNNLDGTATNMWAAGGLLTVKTSDGATIAGIRADGTGASHIYDAGALVKSTTRGRDLGLIKFELDLTSGTYKVWKNGVAVSGAAGTTNTSDTFNLPTMENIDAENIVFTFTNEGDYIDNVKVYVPEA